MKNEILLDRLIKVLPSLIFERGFCLGPKLDDVTVSQSLGFGNGFIGQLYIGDEDIFEPRIYFSIEFLKENYTKINRTDYIINLIKEKIPDVSFKIWESFSSQNNKILIFDAIIDETGSIKENIYHWRLNELSNSQSSPVMYPIPIRMRTKPSMGFPINNKGVNFVVTDFQGKNDDEFFFDVFVQRK